MKLALSNRFLFTVLFVGLLSTARAVAAPGTLNVYWADVEGGAATLIVTPAGESVLIDAGNPGARDSGRIHKMASEVAGLKKIDYYVTTHFHIDHFGGTAEVAQLIPMGTVYDNGIPDLDPDGNANNTRWPLMSKPYREFKADKRAVIQAGDVLPLKQAEGQPKLTLRCLAAKQKFISPDASAPKSNEFCAEPKEKAKDTSDNANSVVLLLQYGAFDLFIGGDLTWNTESQLVCPVNLVGTVDVYQVTHHGLDRSNNPQVVRSLAPTVSIMSNGTAKGCETETAATLKATPSLQASYQIHRNLRSAQNNTADEYIANLEAQCQGNHIQLSVDPAANSYTVSIPAKNHSRTFQVK